MSMRRFWKWRYMIPLAIVAAPLVIAIFVVVSGGLVMLLWNWLLPPLFGWPTITLLQGFGLLALCRILFGGLGRGGGHGQGMTRDERARVRARFCRTPAERHGPTVVPD